LGVLWKRISLPVERVLAYEEEVSGVSWRAVRRADVGVDLNRVAVSKHNLSVARGTMNNDVFVQTVTQ
jgi:hypothetical protein